MGIIRKTYDWVLSWANSRWGAAALFFISFAESSFFPIPPDVLLIALCLGCTTKWFRYALICTLGSVLGALAGYCLGYFLWHAPSGEFTAIAEFFYRVIPGFTIDKYESISALYNKYDFWIIFVTGFTPIPYKLITITAGIFHINIPMFIFSSIISRGMRFFLTAWLIGRYGEPIKNFIDKYLNWLAVSFLVLLIGGFVCVKYFF